jgi:hypothetical protein
VPKNAFQEVGWRKTEATIDVGLQYDDLFI